MLVTETWNPAQILKALAFDAKDLFFPNLKSTRNNLTVLATSPEEEQITVSDVFLGLTNFFVQLIFEIQCQFTVVAFTISSLTIWIAMHNFMRLGNPKVDIILTNGDGGNQVFNSNKDKIIADTFHDVLNELIKVVNAVNSAWRQASVFVVLQTATWLSSDLDVIIKTKDIFSKMYIIILFGFLSVGLVLSAECSRRVRKHRIFEVTVK